MATEPRWYGRSRGRKQGRKGGRGQPINTGRTKKMKINRETAICGITLPFWSNEPTEHTHQDQSQEAYEEHMQKSKVNDFVRAGNSVVPLLSLLYPPSTIQSPFLCLFALQAPYMLWACTHKRVYIYARISTYISTGAPPCVPLLPYTSIHTFFYILMYLCIFCTCENICECIFLPLLIFACLPLDIQACLSLIIGLHICTCMTHPCRPWE